MSQFFSSSAAALGLAFIDLDTASVGPFLLSRPFVIGPALGFALGDPWRGAAFGAIFEALTLGELPLGGRLDISSSIAAGTAAWLGCATARIPAEAAFLGGLAAGWGHARVEASLRSRRVLHARRVESALAEGRPPRLGVELLRALSVQVLATFAVVLVALTLGAALLRWAWLIAPECAHAGARAAFLTAPWIGVGGIVASSLRRCA